MNSMARDLRQCQLRIQAIQEQFEAEMASHRMNLADISDTIRDLAKRAADLESKPS